MSLYKSPNPNGELETVVDMNFDHELYLAISLEDVIVSSYRAIIAKFGSTENIIRAKGFYDGKENAKDVFRMSGVFYQSKISKDGNYVSPHYLDCSVNSFPGVWDIGKKKKVVFSAKENEDDVIDKKCELLFTGRSTLEELGGVLH